MPYDIRGNAHSGYSVINQETGEVKNNRNKIHSRKQAEAYMRALYANEPKSSEPTPGAAYGKSMVLDDTYRPVVPVEGFINGGRVPLVQRRTAGSSKKGAAGEQMQSGVDGQNRQTSAGKRPSKAVHKSAGKSKGPSGKAGPLNERGTETGDGDTRVPEGSEVQRRLPTAKAKASGVGASPTDAPFRASAGRSAPLGNGSAAASAFDSNVVSAGKAGTVPPVVKRSAGRSDSGTGTASSLQERGKATGNVAKNPGGAGPSAGKAGRAKALPGKGTMDVSLGGSKRGKAKGILAAPKGTTSNTNDPRKPRRHVPGFLLGGKPALPKTIPGKAKHAKSRAKTLDANMSPMAGDYTEQQGLGGIPSTMPPLNAPMEQAGPAMEKGGKLSTKERKGLKSSTFGLPAQRKYPMPDKSHAANAKARATQQEEKGNLSSSDKAKIDAKANSILSRLMGGKVKTSAGYEKGGMAKTAGYEKGGKTILSRLASNLRRSRSK